MATELQAQWDYPLIGVKEDKTTDRCGTPDGNAFELIGFEAQVNGSLRPFPGFRKLQDLSGFSTDDNLTSMKGFTLSNVSRNSFIFGIMMKGGTTNKVYSQIVGSGTTISILTYTPGPTDLSGGDDIAVVDTTLFILNRGSVPYAFVRGTAGNVRYAAGAGSRPTATVTLTPVLVGDGTLLTPGDYAVAVQWVSTITNRKSNFSRIYSVKEADFGGANLYMEVATSIGSDFDEFVFLRSVRTQDGGGVFAGSLLYEEYEGSTSPVQAQFQDLELVYQDIHTDPILFESSLEKAGCGVGYEGTFVISNIAESSAETSPSKGRIRWSSLKYNSPELFNVNSVYYGLPTEDPIAFHIVAGNLIGFGRTKLFHVRKEGDAIRVQEMHEGYGVINKHAADVVGSVCYFVSDTGLKVITANGQLDEITSLDYLIIEQWQGYKDEIWVAFDPFLNALVVLNTALEHAAIIWFKTNTVTEIVDARFNGVCRVPWYVDPTDATSKMTERAVFSGKDGGLYVINWDRSVGVDPSTAVGDLNPVKNSMMPTGGDSIFVVTSQGIGGASTSLAVSTAGLTMPTDIDNAYLYELTGDYVGRKHQILSVAGNTFTVAGSPPDVPDVGVRIGISPVYSRWVGHTIMPKEENGVPIGSPTDFLRVRHVSSMTCAMVDVQGINSTSTYARWRGQLWKGNAYNDPYTEQFPMTNAGGVIRSIREGESPNAAAFGASETGPKHGANATAIAPGWECFTPDVDYKLLCVRVKGKMEATERTTRSS